MSATPRKAPSKGLIVALLMLAAFSVTLFVWQWRSDARQGSRVEGTEIETVHRGDASDRREHKVPGGAPSVAGKTANDSPRLGNPPVSGDVVVIPDGTPWEISIECRDVGGALLSGVRLGCEVSSMEVEENGARFYSKSSLQSGKDGRVSIQGAPGRQLSCVVEDPGLYAAPVQAEFAAAQQVLRLVVETTVTVRVRAQYDDGQPVTYMGEFRDSQKGGFSTSVGLNHDGAAIVSRVPIRDELHCLIFGQKRPGYGKVDVTFRRDQLESSMELLVIVPKATDTGSLVVRFGEAALPTGSVALLQREKGVSEYKQLAPGTKAVSWPLLSPSVRYRVTSLAPRPGDRTG